MRVDDDIESDLVVAFHPYHLGRGMGRRADKRSTTPQTSPVGRWKTVNDATGKAESIVNIWEEEGRLYGRIEQLLDPDPKCPNPLWHYRRGDTADSNLNSWQTNSTCPN
jgi:hypothetical protein